jgi:hypothetical protein
MPPETTASVLLSRSRRGRGPGPSGANSRLDAALPSFPGGWPGVLALDAADDRPGQMLGGVMNGWG